MIRRSRLAVAPALAVVVIAVTLSGCGGGGGGASGAGNGGSSSGNGGSAAPPTYQLGFEQQPSSVVLGNAVTAVIALQQNGSIVTSGPNSGDAIQLRLLDSTGNVISTAGSSNLVAGVLKATITPATPGTFTIVATDGASSSVQSATSHAFSVTAPQPAISAIGPAQIMLGASVPIMMVLGRNLPSAATILVDQVAVSGAAATPNLLTFSPPPAAVSTPGQHTVMVNNLGPLDFSVYAPGQFTPAVSALPVYPAANGGAIHMFVGDLDGDGQPDVILGWQWLRGLGKGQLGGLQPLSVTSLPAGVTSGSVVAVGHVAGTAALDLIAWTRQGCPSGESGLFALLNDGQANFHAGPLTCVMGQFVNRAFIADLDGNGAQSLVAEVGAGIDDVVTLPLAAGGALGAPAVVAANAANNTLALGSFTNDGRLDLVYEGVNAQGVAEGLALLLNQGGGAFQSALPSQLAGVTGSFVLGDFNHDGNLDILAQPTAYSGQIDFFSGHGDGTFQSPVASALPSANAFLRALVTGDFDGDGNLDAAAVADADFNAGLLYLWGRGDGTFQAQVVPADTASALATGDLDGNGVPDVVTANANAVTVSLGAQDSRPSSPTFFSAAGGGSAAPLAPGQLASILSGRLLFVNNGNGTFTSIAAPSGAMLLADADGDGYADILGTDPQGDIVIWPGRGGGQFGAPTTIAAPNNCASCDGLQVADVDGDGYPDIVGDGFILYGEGGMNFQLASIPENSGMTPMILGDFAGNGRKDIVLVGQGEELVNQGYRQFSVIASPFNGAAPGPNVVADFNGDGRDDVAVSQENGDVYVYDGQPDGSLLLTSALSTFAGAGQLAAIPTPGGAPTLVVGAPFGSSTYGATLFSPQSNGAFARAFIAAGLQPQAISVADFNGDGHPDLAFGVADAGGLSILWGH